MSSTSPSGGKRRSPDLLSRANRSSWRHITPLGMPVVPPVYSRMRSSGLVPRARRDDRRPTLATSSYGTAQSGQGPLPSSTQSQLRIRGTSSRISATRSTKEPWKTTATASESSHRYASSSLGVAVVGVDRHESHLGGGIDGLEVLRAIGEVDRHLVLLPDAPPEQPARHPVGPAVQLAPGGAALALDDRDRRRLHVGHGVPDVGEVPAGHGPCLLAGPYVERHPGPASRTPWP